MGKAIALLFLTVLGILTWWWVMIYGWGLSIKSVPVLIIGFFIQLFIASLSSIVTKE